MKKRLFGFFLAVVMVVGLLPTAAFAAGTDTGKAIQLVDGGVAANIGGGQADNIYYGTYQQSSGENGSFNVDPVKWRVLSNAEGKLFVLSDQNLDTVQYSDSLVEKLTWAECTLRTWLNGSFIGTAFTGGEQSAIATTTVVNDDNKEYGTEGGEDTYDKIFLLSIEEASNPSFFPDGDSSRVAVNTAYVAAGGTAGAYHNPEGRADIWWLRSPGFKTYMTSLVVENGEAGGQGAYNNASGPAVRPAFNIDLNSVLFTSAAEGGKSAAGMDNGLTALNDYTGNEWKLTVLDSGRSFGAETTAYNQETKTVTVAYSGAATGENEYISAIIKNSAGEVTYYGRIKAVEVEDDAEGSFEVNLSGKLNEGDTFYVFNEQYNGDKMTDYSSSLVPVCVTTYSVTNVLTNITSNNQSTYRLADDAADYTATLTAADGYALPENIDVKVADAALTAGTEYTYDSTSGELVIYGDFINGDVTITAAAETVPGVPTDLKATPGDGKVVLSWNAPATDGGSAITGYEYQINDGEWVSTGSTDTSCTVTGLTNGTEYSFKVRAVNRVGAGDASSAVKVKPVAPVAVQTGDSSHVTFWVGIAAVGVGAMAASLVLQKKRQGGR